MTDANALKVAVCECLLAINAEDERPIIPPTAIDWIGNRIVSAMSGLPDDMKDALVDAVDDLWTNIAAREMRQLRAETVDLCKFVHQVRGHGAHWTDWKHRR